MSLKTAQAKNFEQLTPATTWVIEHNLGRAVAVDCFIPVDGKHEKILPRSISLVDDNTVHVNFSSPYKGKARLV